MLNNLDWIGVVFNLVGCYLNAKKKMSCWLVWIAGNTVWLIYWFPKSEYAAIILTIVYSVLNVYGYRCWKKMAKEESKGREQMKHKELGVEVVQ